MVECTGCGNDAMPTRDENGIRCYECPDCGIRIYIALGTIAP